MDKRWSIPQWLRLRFPCALCNQYHQNNAAVCEKCQVLLPRQQFTCQVCAHPLTDASLLLCGHCIKSPPSFDSATAPLLFEEPARTLIHQFKYHEGLFLTSFLAQQMLTMTPKNIYQTDCLVPIPMYPKSLSQRGYNQALELTKHLSKQLQIPYQKKLCIKTKSTPSQASLNKKERQINLVGAFEVKACKYQHITLIDDIMTTGSTAQILATAFKKQGAKRVDVWCIARAVIGD